MQASNISLPAFFLAHNIIDGMWIFTAPALFLGPYYYLTLPRMAFGSYYIVGVMVGEAHPYNLQSSSQVCLWCRKLSGLGHVPPEPSLTPNPSNLPPITHAQVCWWCSGLAYMVSSVVPPQNVLMTGVFIALIFGAFIQGLSPTIASVRGTIMEYIMALGYNRYKGVQGARGVGKVRW